LRRATFYLHYRDKEELLLAILGETFHELENKMDKLEFEVFGFDAEKATYLVIFRHAQENANLYRSIFGGHGAPTITRYIREYLMRLFLDGAQVCRPPLDMTMPPEVLANYSATIKLNMALWWLEQEMPYPPEQMADMCARLTLNGLQIALNDQIAIPSR
jgi:AcrR family transcriptional regulator